MLVLRDGELPFGVALLLIILAPLEHIVSIEAVLFVVCISVLLLEALIKKSLRVDKAVAIIFYLAYAYVTTLWAEGFSWSLGNLVTLIVYGYLFLQLQFSITLEQYEKLKAAMVVQSAFVIMLVVSFGSYMDGRLWIISASTGLDPNYLSCWFILPICIDIEWFFRSDKRMCIRLFALAEACISMAIIALTGSRAGFVVSILTIGICALYSLRSIVKQHPIYTIVISIGLILLAYIGYNNLPETLVNRLAQTQGAGSRGVIWEEMFKTLLDDPFGLIFGYGMGTVTLHTSSGNVAHNTYLDILFQFGVIGLGIYVYFCVYCLKKAYKKDLYISIGLLCILIALLTLSASTMRFLIFALLLASIEVRSRSNMRINKK